MVSREKFFEEAEAAGWPPQLAADFIEQIGGWDEFVECAPDIYHHGAQGGFSGFIYSSDMDELRQKYALVILSHLMADAYNVGLEVIDILGVDTPIEAASWRDALDGDRLVWYALESLAEVLFTINIEEAFLSE